MAIIGPTPTRLGLAKSLNHWRAPPPGRTRHDGDLTGSHESTELFDVDMDQLAGVAAHVATHWLCRNGA